MAINLKTKTLWINPNGAAKALADNCRTSNPNAAKIFDVLTIIPMANWFGSWADGDDIDSVLNQAGDQLTTLVLYNIPQRDLGSYSAGGAVSASAYKAWIDSIASGIKNRFCFIVIEPDALAMINQMNEAGRVERYDCVNYAVDKLVTTGAYVYLDAGDSGWSNPTTMSDLLIKAGVTKTRGLASNVAHFRTTKNEHIYAAEICAKIKISHGADLHYILDTGRNGNGPYVVKPGMSSQIGWCNPPNAGFGLRPTLKINNVVYPYCDATLWIKGLSSDGSREGAPAAGQPYPEQVIRMYWQARPIFPIIF